MFTSRLFWTVAVVVLSTALVTEGLRMTNGPKKCCFSFVKKSLSKSQVVSYKQTSQQCSKQGVIFLTRRGFQVCADPAAAWVKTNIEFLDSLPKTSKTVMKL
ncbi:C-C motif chemokine 5-like [Arapaima gigas]